MSTVEASAREAPATTAPTLRNYVAGRWIDAEAPEGTLEDRDPATGDLAVMVPLSGATDVDAAVRAARAIPHLLKEENLEGVASGVDVELVRQPVGVVAAITPRKKVLTSRW